MYNFSFFADLPCGELFGWFTCKADWRDKWGGLVRQMAQTVTPLAPDK